MTNDIKLFKYKKIRSHYDEDAEKCLFLLVIKKDVQGRNVLEQIKDKIK